ncbi:MAG: preprotein translocase subunit SecG [Gammaproteobacteria bacterium]|nr:preprotein translocase subunit SecG [Gammaproteobacteria bacterium]
MQPVLLVVQILVAISLIALVLLQHGKGADMGAAFGAGASGTVFGSRGSASFLTRVTAVLAAVFFLNSMVLAYMGTRVADRSSVVERVQPAPSVEDTLLDVPAEPEDADKPSDVPSVPPG